jgi:hypothetical protein
MGRRQIKKTALIDALSKLIQCAGRDLDSLRAHGSADITRTAESFSQVAICAVQYALAAGKEDY